MVENIVLRRFDGVTVGLKPSRIIRVRGSIPGSEHGRSRVDGLITPFYDDRPDDIAAAVSAQIPSFANLTQPDRSYVWFDAAQASGPVPVARSKETDNIKSALWIGNNIQYVSNTPQEVFDLISSFDGNAEPPVEFVSRQISGESGSVARAYHDSSIWDSQIYESSETEPET